jgi:hypothetical protein
MWMEAVRSSVFTTQNTKISTQCRSENLTHIYTIKYVFIIGGILDWMLDLLNAYTCNSEIKVITAQSLISTLYKSPQHTLNFFSACCVFTSRSPVTAYNSGDPSASAPRSSLNGGSLLTDSFLHKLLNSTDLVAPVVFLITHLNGPRRKHRSFSYVNSFRANVFAPPSNGLGNLVY